MRVWPVLQTWGRALTGRVPNLSLEITRECPLRCPGCYAYEDAHLGTGQNLRSLADFRGQELVDRVLRLVDEHKPLHLSVVGGDPLVRYRELDQILPQVSARGVYVQVVTSAFREIPKAWATIPNLQVVVSIDGLQPEHDVRRKPATYDRILKNIAGHRITVHCTVTAQMTEREGYLDEFVRFWSGLDTVRKIWMSLFTPQRGASDPECLTPAQRERVVADLLTIRRHAPKLDLNDATLREFLAPPASPDECIFAKTTTSISADLKTRITPCQFGGDPDCSRCGCIASMGLAAIGHYKLVGPLTAGMIFHNSIRFGRALRRVVDSPKPEGTPDNPLKQIA